MKAHEFIDLDRYPIGDTGSEPWKRLVARTMDELAEDGCAVLNGFIRAEQMETLIAESDRVAPRGHRSFNRTNAYFTKDDPTLPGSHPLRRFYDRSNSFVPADNFGGDSILRAIYEWPVFPKFIQGCSRRENLLPLR